MDAIEQMAYYGTSVYTPTDEKALDRYNAGDSYRKIRRDGYTMNDLLSEMIVASPVYQQARQLFSSDARYGQPFLEQLNAISYSMRIPEKGGNRVVENNITSAYNNVVAQISSLVAEYNNFINSLPETQVEQLKSAGINSDITGEGVQPSSMTQTGIEQVPEVSTPTELDIATQAINGVNTFLNLCTTFSGAFTSLSQLGPSLKMADANLTLAGLNADSLRTALDLAEQEGWYKQQLYDYLATQMGYDPRPKNKYSSAYDSDGAVIDSLDANQYAAGASSDMKRVEAETLNSPVVVGHNADGTPIEKKGLEVFKDMSKFQLATQYSQAIERSIRAEISRLTSSLSETLAQSASMSQDAFTGDYFSELNGAGMAQLEMFAQGQAVESTAIQMDNQDIANRILALQKYLLEIERINSSARWMFTEKWINLGELDDTYSIFSNFALFGMPANDTFIHQPNGIGISKGDVNWYTDYIEQLVRIKNAAFGGPKKVK